MSLGAYSGVLDITSNYQLGNDVVFGAFVGRNWAIGSNMYAGAELSLNGPSSVLRDDYQISYIFDAKARVGTMIGEKAFAYAFAGISGGLYDNDYTYGLFGFNAGVGVEFPVSDMMRIGVDYTARTMTNLDDTSTIGSFTVRAIFEF